MSEKIENALLWTLIVLTTLVVELSHLIVRVLTLGFYRPNFWPALGKLAKRWV